AVSLPLVLLLLDLWPLRRWAKEGPAKVLLEKIPFFLAALGAGLLAPLAQGGAGNLGMNETVPLVERGLNAFHSIALYLWKMVLPIGLRPFYPLDPVDPGRVPMGLFCLGLVLVLGWVLFQQRSKNMGLGVAALYYLITLGPVLGLVQTGS